MRTTLRGMHFLQHKGKGWFPPDMCDTKVQGHGDMRQFTLLAATSMDGVMLPHQIVFEGSTANCLPAFRNVTWKQSSDLGSGSVQKMEKQKVVECSTAFRGRMEHDHGDCKGKVCGCYVPTPRAGGDVLGEEHDDPARYSPSQLIMENIGSACATSNGEVCPRLRILPFLFCSTTQGFLLFYLSLDSPSQVPLLLRYSDSLPRLSHLGPAFSFLILHSRFLRFLSDSLGQPEPIPDSAPPSRFSCLSSYS